MAGCTQSDETDVKRREPKRRGVPDDHSSKARRSLFSGSIEKFLIGVILGDIRASLGGCASKRSP
jgi:hypothetical protein